MKKIINNPNDVVSDMVSGMIQAFPEELEQIDGTMVIKRKELSSNKVGLVSGGGSGHEPAHAGYVGKGMLDAAVAGEVFTSPTPDQILEAIKAVDTGHGVLLIVKNYTGDVMNFDMASELAESEGIKVEQVIVNDDVAVEDSDFTTGRRGIAGTVFVHKIAGAMAETGATLNEVKEVAEKTINQVRSMGMALTPCTVPAAGKPSFQLEENEMEIGIGIHGEAGIERKPIASAEDIANELTQKVFDDLGLQSGDEVAVMINGLGATPEMELFILQKHVNHLLENKRLSVFRTYVGEFMTSLEMTGCSVTLLKLDDQLKSLLEAASEATAFRV
ncbi:dihydroxyacetone kinase [Oceanobacillus iheyensis HTE831]|uniref:Dihydroxyacetone kinase n=1 Tax=Oceanobacillus iheyensis (strain DSM 14371 / CIP 107618 / JCM 11309 / KCTC 3954 / HTE831) TaxID=221109 RepID=Q8ENK8_OCEIH|nr:dihydroxyacetone kinase subunit DhaK [Oceanobacillus iheyensis]BAC14430.1 dihydroxyacetone kinase [Oceanobacillus iheyensis HTE831]